MHTLQQHTDEIGATARSLEQLIEERGDDEMKQAMSAHHTALTVGWAALKVEHPELDWSTTGGASAQGAAPQSGGKHEPPKPGTGGGGGGT